MTMKKLARAITLFAIAAVLALAFGGCTGTAGSSSSASAASSSPPSSSSVQASSSAAGMASSSSSAASTSVTESGEYSDKESVALYIHLYGHLPGNYISKTKARKAGWVNTEGNLWDVLPGMSIGGSEFYNDEGKLPEAQGRRWTECDIDYQGGYRNEKRIVFSNDGLVFYTGDHYNTFEQLY